MNEIDTLRTRLQVVMGGVMTFRPKFSAAVSTLKAATDCREGVPGSADPEIVREQYTMFIDALESAESIVESMGEIAEIAEEGLEAFDQMSAEFERVKAEIKRLKDEGEGWRGDAS